MTTKTITYEEVTERLKNKNLEDYTYNDVFDRYYAYGEGHELAQPEIQKLFIKYGMIEELILAVQSIITNKEVVEGILSSNIYVPMEHYAAIRGKIESTEITEDQELPKGINWLFLNFKAEQFWNRDTNSWENFTYGINHHKYKYAYCEENQTQYKEEIDKNIGQDLIVIVKWISSEIQYPPLCCILKNETSKNKE